MVHRGQHIPCTCLFYVHGMRMCIARILHIPYLCARYAHVQLMIFICATTHRMCSLCNDLCSNCVPCLLAYIWAATEQVYVLCTVLVGGVEIKEVCKHIYYWFCANVYGNEITVRPLISSPFPIDAFWTSHSISTKYQPMEPTLQTL
jgi:hypothetical protein